MPVNPFPDVADVESIEVVPPEASEMVFVDFTAYNSKNYYLEGDVGVPGRMPWTGNETVLDALQYAGGLLSTADPKQITLVRPARGGKPARIYQGRSRSDPGKGASRDELSDLSGRPFGRRAERGRHEDRRDRPTECADPDD